LIRNIHELWEHARFFCEDEGARESEN
jgi:hypothetical protein